MINRTDVNMVSHLQCNEILIKAGSLRAQGFEFKGSKNRTLTVLEVARTLESAENDSE